MERIDLKKSLRVWLFIFFLIFSIITLFYKGLQFGIDISGGSIVILKPNSTNLTQEDLDKIKNVFETRFNAFGLADVNVFYSRSLVDNSIYFYIESPSLSPEYIKDFITRQGFFEAKIGNKTVFTGEDVECVGCSVAPPPKCREFSNGWICSGSISLRISKEAAQKFAQITSNLSVEGNRLNETIDFYLDNKLITNLTISSDLKGIAAKNVQINLVGKGKTKEEAMDNLQKEIKKIKGLLESGSIPTKFVIVKTNKFESKLGKDFLKNAVIIGLVSVILIALIIYLKYPYLPIFLAIILSLISETIIILAFASIIGWQLDLASLAGIIVAIGTGVDDLIVITDQIIRRIHRFERRIEEAYNLVLFSWITTVLAMLPLLFSEFIFLRGFALTTIIGVTVGVFITRPVYKEIISFIAYKLEKNK